MKFKSIALVAIFLLVPAIVAAQEITRKDFINSEWRMKAQFHQRLLDRNGPGAILDQSDYDVKYWELNVDITNISGRVITGKVAMTSAAVINSLTSVDYDLHYAMHVDSVKINGLPAIFNHNASTLTITLDRAYSPGEQFTTLVWYHGTPAGGEFGSFTWNTHNGHPIISSLSEPDVAREWWPCKDQPHDKADSADVLITVPSNLTATSNGVLVSNQDNGNNTRTFHWHISYPITTYLICVSATNYQSFTNWYVSVGGDSMPVTNYVYPEHYSQAVIDFSIVPEAIGVYAGLFGEYPFMREKYGHSIFPWDGGMEHQCNTSYGANLITGNHTYDWITVHELSHQWFGDMITCDIWPDIWMNEGFASYCEALYYEHMNGFNYYNNYMRTSNAVIDPSGPIYDPDPLFDGNTVYNKGSWVLHMLRGVMGDSAFFQGLRSYANNPQHQYGTITTRQFQHIMEQFYGSDLTSFFDEWVWGQNRPVYRYSWLKQDIGGGQYEVFLHIRQTQSAPAPNVFTMPVRVYPRINNIDTVITVWNDSRANDFRFVVNGNPAALAFDKSYWILRDAYSESYRMNIVTTALPNGLVDSLYNQAVEVRGGIQPYQFSLYSGQLPAGLNLDGNTGVISGSPTMAGIDSFTVRCTDSSSPQLTDDQSYVLVIESRTGVAEDQESAPSAFALVGNYPNPFNAATTIRYDLRGESEVSIDIFDILGRKIQTLVEGRQSAGRHQVTWNAGASPSGIYFYKIRAGGFEDSKKVLLLK